jgi:hypothetical protein
LVTVKYSVPAKRKPIVTNPFVSAGFMTEFVGSSRSRTTPEPTHPAPAVTETLRPSITKVDAVYILLRFVTNHFP